jgi:pimeloyl-ACP methyl ester carboxylesterase
LFVSVRENPAVSARLAQIVGDYSGWHWVSKDPNLWAKDIERLEEIKSPTLIIVGEREVPDFRAISSILQQRIPDARSVVLPSAGHMTNMEAPDQFNEVVERFLGVV